MRTRSSGVLRSRLIDDLVREAIGARAARVAVFEVDHPSTQNAKRERLTARLGRLPANVRFVPVDFEKDDLERALSQAGFQTGAAAAAVWEGVVSYLTPEAVDQNFRMLARILAPRRRLIFTYVHRGALDGSAPFPEARRWRASVGSSGEPFLFGFDPAELAEYLGARGFALLQDASTTEAVALYNGALRRKERGSELYRVAVAERG